MLFLFLASGRPQLLLARTRIQRLGVTLKTLKREDKSKKVDYTLIPYAAEKRVAERFAMGAKKYSRDDWKNATEKDRTSYYASIHRHLRAAQEGDTSEDHLAAIIVDSMILMHVESL